jgi:hypothetical protein
MTDKGLADVRVLKPCATCEKDVWASLRRLECANGTLQFKYQCETCGSALSNALRHEQVPRETCGDWDKLLSEAYWASRSRRLTEETLRKNEDWWAQYNAYLLTPEWRGRRVQVFLRASGLCEGCRKRPPSQVHHLTYAHVTEEFLFELVAVCDECHERLHKDKTQPDAH